jgi:outer membrane immunogenic protein
MKNLLLCGVGILSAFIAGAPAFADEMKVAPKAVAPRAEREAAPAPRQRQRAEPRRAAPQQTQTASNWTGGQAGGSNGVSAMNNNFVEPGSFNFAGCGGVGPFATPCFETPFSFSGTAVSYIIGVFAGYRVQVGNYVVGVEGDINWKNGETSKTQSSPTSWLPTQTFAGSQKQGTDGSLRVRAGYLVTPWTLLYATAGLAVASVSGSYSYYSASFPILPGGVSAVVSGAGSWSDTRVGGTVGVGAETEIAPRVKARVEFRYTDYGSYSKNVPLTNNCGTFFSCGTNARIDLRASEERITAGLGWDLY